MADSQANAPTRREKGKHNRNKRPRFDTKKKFGERRRPKDVENEEITRLQDLYTQVESSNVETFEDFPLSHKTQKGLENAGYTKPTDIQREAILLGLKGNDILGAAKTGSGKTLAFLIPVLECLFRQKWSAHDGLGALIITPTRELAYQIFEVLRKVGKSHDFSAGLVIGGKHVREESEQIPRTNIVICTPGRLLQHMDETVFFKADNLQILVLDEADRILDLGFQQSMNAIIENLPRERQTLLFSATQTKSVKDLARLSLKDPMYVSVHEHSQHSTPAQLEQSYIVCELEDKLSLLWSFIKNHLKNKVLVFMQSCKQVRYAYEILKRLRPGVTVLALHGAMQQLKRVASYQQFCRKQHAVLLATDIAARGLDFPAVHWVMQLDCPEDANTYIHRAGRTARYEKNGEALLVLLPSEKEGMLAQLEEKKIPINTIKVNPKKLWSIQGKVESLLAADVTLKDFAKGAFMSYVKSVHLMSNKKVFDVKALDTDKYALSLGLAVPPRIRFLQKEEKRKKQQEQEKIAAEVDAIFAQAAEREHVYEEKLKDKERVLEEKKASENPSKKESNSDRTTNDSDSDDDSDEDSEESGSEDEGSEENESSESSDSEQSEKANTQKSAVSKRTKNKLDTDNSSERTAFDIGDDDLDDILTVKKKGAVVPSSDEEEEVVKEESNKSKKKAETAMTKYKMAKLLQKKNIKVNSKVQFDEEGEKIIDKLTKPTVESSSEDDECGINIEEAKRRMKKEDEVDRETFRERIKKKHREKRLKEKEKRRKKHQPDESDDGGDGEAVLATDGDDTEPNLDWLPDPDKVYNTGGGSGSDGEASGSDEGSEEESDDGTGNSSSEDEQRPPSKKAKRSSTEEDGDSDEQLGVGMSIEDEEELALKLLG